MRAIPFTDPGYVPGAGEHQRKGGSAVGCVYNDIVQPVEDPRTLGPYEVIDRLAQGGMAELFLARLPGIEGFAKRVVVKRVLPSLARDREFVEMFLGEARLAATLQHQNVVHVHDIGQDEHGYFFAMEYLHGADLGELVRTVGGPLPLEIALEIARGACAGLHYAHERKGANGTPLGIVHRDVSPQNLFVTFDGGIKLLDFGIAKAVQQISSHYTRSGTLRGKLPYMSPEQCQGEVIDRRSDVFSLAVVLWEITVGERLFGGSGQGDFEILKSIVERDAPRPSTRRADYPPALEAIVVRGLRRDRSQRYQTCDAMQVEIEELMKSSNRWASPRDVATFMRSTFAERAAASLPMKAVDDSPGGEVVPFPRSSHSAPQATDPTVDLPKPGRVSVQAPPSTEAAVSPFAATTPSTAPPTPPTGTMPGAARGLSGRTVALLIGGAVVLTAAAMAIGFRVARGGDRETVLPVGSGSGTGVATGSAATLPVIDKPAEDAVWFQPDDYLIVADKPRNGRIDHLRVAKRRSAPDLHDRIEFLTATGNSVTTKHYWQTHLARREELAVGRLAFCLGDYSDRVANPAKTKQASRLGWWMAGPVTDVAELADGKVVVADCTCEVGAVRVGDTPETTSPK